ncbi:MAG TPA: glycerol-3-phosphate dehydrogenase/oxidase [Candidatus Sulfomarinibacteraceae bacterium]|nr:glycerol-3-phosphate dehydrogenase/oxidase [Candidatus Sulfomarinibacteraceae bacterium]
MTRALKSHYDLLIIGGGITGACIAWDAATRGLRAALLERGDFGGATSANSLKTVHGGLRYLQDANLRQVRKMMRERQAFLRIAPHLVHPLPFLMPAYRRRPGRSKLLLGAALKLNDLLSIDRNRDMDPARALPAGRVLSRDECLALVPGLEQDPLSGGILWHDAQIQNTERLLLSFILSAIELGADAANYVRVTGVLQEHHKVTGVTAEDLVTGQSLQIGARVVVNATGAWSHELLSGVPGYERQPRTTQSAAMNLVTRQLLPGPAVALPSRYHRPPPDQSGEIESRMIIIAPWRQYSIVGTLHIPAHGHPDYEAPGSELIEHFVAEINHAYPAARLKCQDVKHVHFGFLPAEENSPRGVTLMRDEQLVDHARHGLPGLITALGVKYTTARHLAEKAVDLVFHSIEHPAPPCQTRFRPIHGGDANGWHTFRQQAIAAVTAEGVSAPVAAHLVDTYGSAYTRLMPYVRQDQCWAEPVAPHEHVTRAEVLHAVRHEMALKLSDVVCRRTELGSAGPPPPQVAEQCATLMAQELGWKRQRVTREIDELYETYAPIV